MAEIGLVASVVQIADTGIKLSITLYTFAETVLTADKSIKEIASDVSLTSSVLEELGQNLKKDQKSRLCSENAVKTAEGIVKECAAIFKEINETLQITLNKIKPTAGGYKAKGKDGSHGGKKMAVAALERLKWPFLQPKMQLLRGNLDRLKSTLVLMLNVITYARKVSEDHVTPSALEDQRKLIEDLARSNQEYTRKFKELTKTVEASSDQLDAVKNTSTKDEGAPPGYLQANIVLPPPEPVNVASEPSTDIKNRHVKLTMQQIPPDSGKMSDELEHYCLLINHLLERIDAVQYKIRNDVRRRIRSDVVHMHEREADQLREVHGHGKFSTAMDSAISWVQALQHIDLDASQTLGSPNIEKRRTMYEKYDDIVLEDDDDVSVHPNSRQSVLRAQETLAQPRMPVERAEKLKQLIEDKRKRSALSIPEPNLTGQSKYQFESDREDSEVENKINFEMDENLATSSVAEGAKALARTNDQDGEEQKRSVGRIAQKSDVSDDIITVNRERLGRAGSSSPEELADFDEVYRECGDVGEMPGKVNEENTNPATMDYALQGELKLARVVEGPQQSRPDSSPPQPQPEPQSQDQQLQQRKVKSVKSRRLYTPIEDNRSILAQQSWGIGSMTAEPSRTHIFVKSEKDNRVQSVDVDSVQCNNATAGPIGTGSKSQRAPTDTQRNRFISSLSDIAAPSRTNSAQLGAKRAQLILQPRNASIGGMGGGLGLSFFENNIAPPGGERQRKQLSKKSNPLDQQRARIEEVLDDGQNGSLSTVASSIGKESTIQLWRELQVLDALISIRDSILEIASSHTLDTKVKRKGSATKNAEDAVSTAQAMWLYVTTIHREAYGQVTDADRVLRVARLVKLALESAPVATQYWTGRAAIEKKIESILGMTEKYGATARTDALRVASWKFGLLASSQRLALRRTWIDGDPSARSEGAEIEPATLWARARHILLSPSLPSGLSGRRPAKDFIAQLCSYESSSVGQVVPLIAELPSRSPDVINPVPNDEQKKKQASEWQAKVMARFQHQREQFLDNQEYIDSDEEDFTSRRGTETPADTGRRIKYTVDEYLKYGPTPAHKLGRWADETASAHSEGLPEDDAHGFGRGDGVDDQRLSEEAVRDDVVEYDMGDNTMVPRKTDPSANRIEELDIVDDLLAQWTTLPRYAARYGIDINQRT